MKEAVYNLFLILDGGLIKYLGVVAHDCDCAGSDAAKLRFLLEKVRSDCERARTFPVPARYRTALAEDGELRTVSGAITIEKYLSLSNAGKQLGIFEELFDAIGAPPDPLVCITPVVDGVPRMDGVAGFGMGPLT